jgi:dolichol-phosphate mannosyltransferase
MSERSREMISIVVPVYNEGQRITDNLQLLISEVETHFEKFEIIVVSDGSTDQTNQKVFDFVHPKLSFIASYENEGKGASVRKGFLESQGDYIFFIDGGMELHPKELKIFFGLARLYDADIVVGSKRHPQSKLDYPLLRRILSRVYQALIKSLFNVDVTDTQVGMKLFRRKVITDVLPHLTINRYAFDLELLCFAAHFGHNKVMEAPIQMNYFLKNSRTFSLEALHIFKVGYDLLADTFKIYRRIQKLKKTENVRQQK